MSVDIFDGPEPPREQPPFAENLGNGQFAIGRGPRTTSNKPQGAISWVLTRDDLLNLVEMIRNASAVVMDLETTGLDEHATTGGKSNGGVAARIVMAALTLPQRGRDGDWDGADPVTYLVPLSHPRSPFLGEWVKVMRLIARTMVKYQPPYINAHAKFDARWTYACTGVDIVDLISWDTQMTSHLLDETESTKLKETVPRIFGVPRWDDHDLSYPGAAEDVEFWELGEYAARDTWWVWELYLRQLRETFLDDDEDEPIGAEEVAYARLGQVAKNVVVPTAKSLGKMEQRGITLDVDYVEEHLEENLATASEKLTELAERYDMDLDKASTATASGWFKELTAKAVENGELQIMGMTKAGSVQWTKYILQKQARNGYEVAQTILDQRNAEKQSQFLRSWLEKVTPQGTIHSTFRAGHVTTGRLSSSDPNLQQVSKALKPAFVPRPGYYLAELDYSQLELRVAAFISRCQPMLDAYNAGQDLHSLLAADILTRRARHADPSAPPVPLEDVTPEDRQGAKSANFGLLYMQGVQGFRSYADKVYGVEFTEEEAQEVYDGFFATWTGMHEWHERVKKSASGRGYVTSPIGRRRLLHNIHDGNDYLRSEAERQAVNAPVQGFGSDLMQMAIASIYGLMPGSTRVPNAHPVATVHDSVILEVPQDGWQDVVEECQERMTNLDPWLRSMGCELDVPLVADATVGTRWGWSDVSDGE